MCETYDPPKQRVRLLPDEAKRLRLVRRLKDKSFDMLIAAEKAGRPDLQNLSLERIKRMRPIENAILYG